MIDGYHVGDCRELLRQLPDESVHCCVTSPPYWGLRDYGTAAWDGGDPACGHVAQSRPPVSGSSSTLGFPADGGPRRIADGNTYHNAYTAQYRDVCGKCGARRVDRQLGLEPTPEEYVTSMVEVFREVRRVLRGDGTCWVNLGDSYASDVKGSGGVGKSTMGVSRIDENGQAFEPRKVAPGLPSKNLVGIPWRVAFALQADGWYLRSDIIWAKPNPMPESVTDRPTKAHEYLFLLSKSERYYYDGEAIREDLSASTLERWSNGGKRFNGHDEYFKERDGGRKHIGQLGNTGLPPSGMRNRRTVWTIATEPTPDAHFATFPRKLVEPCILAGCPLGGVVLDPFGGSGTVGRVAEDLGRHWLLFDLNPKYAEIAKRKTAQMGLLARAV